MFQNSSVREEGGGMKEDHGGFTNERPGTDHVMLGPMRGLEINYMGGGHPNIHIATL